MYIESIGLANYKCFEHAEINCSRNVNLVVGENNAGKSSLLYTILNLQQERIANSALRLGTDNLRIVVGLRNVDHEKVATVHREQVRRQQHVPQPVNVEWRYEIMGHAVRQIIFIPNEPPQAFERFSRSQPNNPIFPYLSERRVSAFGDRLNAEAAFTADGLLHNLPAKLTRIFTSPGLLPSYQRACDDVLGFIVSLHPSTASMTPGREIDPLAHHFIPLTEMGIGTQHAVGFIVELILARNQIFVIEELENDLHPRALRRLLALVRDSVSAGNQFFISTHSNVVLRELGSIEGSRVIEVRGISDSRPPESTAEVLPDDPARRMELLRSLGYEFGDLQLADAWLVVEESSAEQIIKEFLIPWFVSGLAGRLLTVAGQGVEDAKSRFVVLHRMMVYLHLEPVYRSRSWVLFDGDATGLQGRVDLQAKFQGWPRDRFSNFSQPDFEHYYPAQFQADAAECLQLQGQASRDAKKQLLHRVVTYLRTDGAAREALRASAAEVIGVLKAINRQLAE